MDIVESLKNGAVGLFPTDTIYGLSASAYDKESVERIYDIKGRSHQAPMIVLLSDINDLKAFRLSPKADTDRYLRQNWPGKITFILPLEKGFDYITRGSGGIAFRVPGDAKLRAILQETGPLVSTSANPSGQKPASNVAEAKAYFGDKLDFYMDAGDLFSEPSTLVDLNSNRPAVLRQGETPFRI